MGTRLNRIATALVRYRFRSGARELQTLVFHARRLMRFRIILFTVFSILFQPRVFAADAAAAVRDVLLKNVAAFERGDYAATERLWAHGDEVSVFESGYPNYGW